MRIPLRIAAVFALAAVTAVPISGAASASVARPAARAAGAQVRGISASRPAASVPGGTRLWVARFTGGAGRTATGASVAVSPDHAIVYVTGITQSTTRAQARDYTTVAYNAVTGAQIWMARYEGVSNHPRALPYITVGVKGSAVFVAGTFGFAGLRSQYLVLAYNAVTGAALWTAKPPAGLAFISGVAAGPETVPGDPQSAQVFVTGASGGFTRPYYVTVALNAASGTMNWQANTTFAPKISQQATSIAVSPNGSAVFVAGVQGLVALNAGTGAALWQDRYRNVWLRHPRLAVSPDSSTVFATSKSRQGITDHWVTNAYNAATGAIKWTAFYRPAGTADPAALAVSPDGSALYVTGSAGVCCTAIHGVTIAYNAATGARLWLVVHYAHHYGGTSATSIAVSPNGQEVFTTGYRPAPPSNGSENVTIAYAAATGAQLWMTPYREGNSPSTTLNTVVVSRDGQRVFIFGPGTGTEYLTVAYKA